MPTHPLFLQDYPSTFYPLRWLVSSGEEVPFKSEIRIIPHNQSGLAKSDLAGHTWDPNYLLRLQRHEYFGFHPEIWLNGISGWFIPLSGLKCLRAVGPLQKLGRHESGSLPDLTQSSQRLSHLDFTQTSIIVRSPSQYTLEMASDPESILEALKEGWETQVCERRLQSGEWRAEIFKIVG